MSRVDPQAWGALNPVREFTLLNSTDEPVVIMYSGETRAIPPVGVIVYPHSKYADVCHSAKDSEGNWIPGTLVLRDIYNSSDLGDFGETLTVWSAANAIKHSLGIDVRTGQATGEYARRGLSLLPASPAPELVEAVRADGRARYEEWRLKEAQEIVEAYDEKNAARARVNMQPIPPGVEYQRAAALLQVKYELVKKQAVRSMEPYVQAPQATAEILGEEAPEAPQAEDQTLDDQVAAMMNNPEALRILKEKYKTWPMGGKKKTEA